VDRPELYAAGKMAILVQGHLALSLGQLELAPDTVHDFGDLALSAGGVLHGTVRTTGGRPLPRARIEVFRTMRPSGLVAFANTEGAFRIDGVPDSKVLVVVSADGYQSKQLSINPAGANVQVELVARVSVRGVLRTRAGDPVAGTTIWVTPYLGPDEMGAVKVSALGVTDGKGAFSGTVAPGKHVFGTRVDGVLVGSGVVEAKEAEPLTIELQPRGP